MFCILEVSEGENLDRLTEGLTNEIRVELYQSGCTLISEVSKVAKAVDSAMWCCKTMREHHPVHDFVRPTSDSTPM